MTVFIDGKKINETSLAGVSLADTLCFARQDEKPEALEALRLPKLLRIDAAESWSTRFESHDDFDYMRIGLPDFEDGYEKCKSAELFLLGSKLLIFSDGIPASDILMQMVSERADNPIAPEDALFLYFSFLTEKDSGRLEDIENELWGLEEALDDEEKMDYLHEIALLGQRLLVLKRYVQALHQLLTDLEENRNSLLSREHLHAFHRHTKRAEGFVRSVQSLEQALARFEKGYQARLTLRQNRAVHLAAIAAAICLPLTVLTGWYGMNFAMPEYDMGFVYPLLAGLSLAAVGGVLVLFKLKKI